MAIKNNNQNQKSLTIRRKKTWLKNINIVCIVDALFQRTQKKISVTNQNALKLPNKSKLLSLFVIGLFLASLFVGFYIPKVNAGTSNFGLQSIGANNAGGYVGFYLGSAYACSHTGTLTDFYIYLTAVSGCHIRAAIYSDNSGSPNALLAQSGSVAMSSDGWQDISGFSLPVVATTTYWLVFQLDSAVPHIWYDSTGTNYYAFASYGAFSDPFGAGDTWGFDCSMYAVVTYSATPSLTFNPTYMYNSTRAGNTTSLSISLTDNLNNLQGYRFASNATGSIVNSTYASFSDAYPTQTINSTVTLPSSGHVLVQWWANDTSGTENYSAVFLLTCFTINAATVIGNQVYMQNGTLLQMKGADYTFFIGDVNAGSGSWMLPDGSIHYTTWNTDYVSDFFNFSQAMNMTTIRTFICVKSWQNNIGNYQSNLEYFITQAANRNMYVDICPYCDNDSGSNQPLVLPWDEPGNNVLNNSADFVNFWGNLSNTLKNYPNVMFELFNEPQGNEATWFSVCQQTIDNIRSTGATQPIIIQYGFQISYDFNPIGGGVRGDMSFVNTYPLYDQCGNIIYSIHMYAKYNNGFYNSSSGLMVTGYSYINFALNACGLYPVASNYPVFVGEIGNDRWDSTTINNPVNNNAVELEQDVYFNNTLTLFKQHGIGYNAFASLPWWDYQTTSGSLSEWGLVNYGVANYSLGTAGVILRDQMGGVNYSTWLQGPVYSITVSSSYGSPTNSGAVSQGSNYATSVTSPVSIGAGVREVCTGYSIDGGGNVAGTNYTFTNVQANHTITYSWQTQYYLTVTSSYGSPQGAGWYAVGATAPFNVTTPFSGGIGTQYVFTSWTGTGAGSYSGGLSSNSVTMNDAVTETASWTTQYYLTPSNDSNCAITPANATWVNSGASQTFNYSASLGFNVTALFIDGVAHTPIGTSYTFTNVLAPHTIAVFSSVALPPVYSSVTASSTVANVSSTISVTVNDAVGLQPNGRYQFGTNNTGSWVWIAIANFTSTPQTLSNTITLNSTVGTVVACQFNCTNNALLSSNTGIQILTTEAPIVTPTPSPTSQIAGHVSFIAGMSYSSFTLIALVPIITAAGLIIVTLRKKPDEEGDMTRDPTEIAVAIVLIIAVDVIIVVATLIVSGFQNSSVAQFLLSLF